MIELQPLALVDREDADAVGGCILDGLAADGLVPFTDKGINVGAVVEREFVQLVVEGTDVGALLFQTVELEDMEETFRQFVERKVE